MQDADAKSRHGIGTRRMEGRGENNAKRRHSLTVQYFAAKFKMKIVNYFLLYTALTKCAYLLLVPFGVLYSEGRAYKREQGFGSGSVSGSAIRKNPGSGSALNQCGSEILKGSMSQPSVDNATFNRQHLCEETKSATATQVE